MRIAEVSPGTAVVALASTVEAETAHRLRALGAECYEKETISAVLPAILSSLARR